MPTMLTLIYFQNRRMVYIHEGTNQRILHVGTFLFLNRHTHFFLQLDLD